ncbi:MAG: DUF5667 domain-containing protein [Nocardioidaceae bacterium]
MVPLPTSRRRAEEFARALDGHPAQVPPHLEPLLTAASRLAGVPLVEPRADFRESLRERLLDAAALEFSPTNTTAAQHQLDPPASTPKHLMTDTGRAVVRRRRLMAAATALVVVGGGTGVAAASQQALPGEMLYPVKRSVENAEVSLASGDRAEGRELLERAVTRLDEARTLGAQSSLTQVDLGVIDAALADFRADASTGGERLLRSYAGSGDAADLHAIRDFTTSAQSELSDLNGAVPGDASPALRSAARTVVALDGLAQRVCPDCTSVLPPLDLSRMLAAPPLGSQASPDASSTVPTPPAPTAADHGATRAAGHDRRDADRGSGPRSGRSDGALAGLELRVPRLTQPADGSEPTATESEGDGRAADQPLRQLLDGTDAPSRTPRSVRAPGAPDVRDLTDPLLDGTRGLIDGVL